jgi:kinesin family protein C1
LERGREATLELCRAHGDLERLRTRLEAQERDILVHSNDASKRVEDLEEKLREADTLRRKLHNTVQELRGNVRVFARVRPFLPSDEVLEEGEKVFDSCISTPADGTSLTLRGNADEASEKALFAGKRAREAVDFSFDRVFGPATGQEEVFREVGEFVQSALDGFQVCLFSYGQTGSGKTHTMQGSGRGAMRGIIPRAMEHVAAYMQEQRGRGWEYEMEVTFVEIYNEAVRDLLVPDKPAQDKAEPTQSLEVCLAKRACGGDQADTGGRRCGATRRLGGRTLSTPLRRQSTRPTATPSIL